MAGIYSQGGSAGHRYAGWLSEVEAKNFQFGGKVFNGSPSAIYVGSNLVWIGWLTNATKQAIVGAFGQRDGTAVINATNAYLTQLAASGQAGKDKATALAGFINEDPMMVCSLGLQPQGVTMPKRYCVITNTSSADSYQNGVNLPYKLNEIVKLEMDGYFASGNNYMLFTALSGNNTTSPWLGTASASGFSNVSRTNFDNPGVDGDTKVATFTCSSTSYAHMFSWSDWNWNLETRVRMLGIFGADGQLMQLIPYEDNGTVYLLDLMDMTRKLTQSRVTPFSIAYTRNGQPWTPSTP